MDEELKIFLEIWISAIILVTYCYYLPHKIKSCPLRLLSVLPVCVLFIVFPLLNSTVHSSLIIAFFLTALAIPKLILFVFEKGPLFPLPPNLFQFICFACLPIKLQKSSNLGNISPTNINNFSKWVFGFKVFVFFSLLLQLYNYKEYTPHNVLIGIYSIHFYLVLEICLSLIKFLASFILGCDLEPQFNEPFLTTSLQDFWGHRWNLMVSDILKLSVYLPIRKYRVKSSDLDLFLAFLATFLVSGVGHELVFFYLTRQKPTWEVSGFFVVHGVCTAAEVAVKRKTKLVQRWPVNPMVSRLLTVGFVLLTSAWLFTPQLIRSGTAERFINEELFLIDFFKRKLFVFLGL